MLIVMKFLMLIMLLIGMMVFLEELMVRIVVWFGGRMVLNWLMLNMLRLEMVKLSSA